MVTAQPWSETNFVVQALIAKCSIPAVDDDPVWCCCGLESVTVQEPHPPSPQLTFEEENTELMDETENITNTTDITDKKEETYVPSPKPEFEKQKKKILKPSRKSNRIPPQKPTSGTSGSQEQERKSLPKKRLASEDLEEQN